MNKEIVRKEFKKKFNGTILITDPCYFIPKNKVNEYSDLENNHCLTYKGIDKNQIRSLENRIEINQSMIDFEKDINLKELKIFKDEIEECKNKINELKKEENFIDCKDIEAPAIDFLKELGFTDCLAGNTIYGDWSCTVYSEGKAIGQFCADSGEYGIFYLDEVLKLNPSFDYHINKKWTSTVIKDFNGEIRIKIIDTYFEHDGKECKDTSVIIEGIGNINFSTKQTVF